jgi:hypothetical protein
MSLVLSTLILLGSPAIGRGEELSFTKVASGTLARTSGVPETCVVAETAADYERAQKIEVRAHDGRWATLSVGVRPGNRRESP